MVVIKNLCHQSFLATSKNMKSFTQIGPQLEVVACLCNSAA